MLPPTSQPGDTKDKIPSQTVTSYPGQEDLDSQPIVLPGHRSKVDQIGTSNRSISPRTPSDNRRPEGSLSRHIAPRFRRTVWPECSISLHHGNRTALYAGIHAEDDRETAR